MVRRPVYDIATRFPEELAIGSWNRAQAGPVLSWIMQLHSLLALGLAALLLGGCSTFERRAEEKAGVFAALDEATRERLRQRDLQPGDSLDMVYIALGAPDERRVRHSADGSETTWVYNAYWQEYQGQALVGYRRYVVRDAKTNRYRIHYEPVRESVFAPREEERIRVTFRGDRVTAIEQAR